MKLFSCFSTSQPSQEGAHRDSRRASDPPRQSSGTRTSSRQSTCSSEPGAPSRGISDEPEDQRRLPSPAYSTVTEEHHHTGPSSNGGAGAQSPRDSPPRRSADAGRASQDVQNDPLLELASSKYAKMRALNEGGSGFVHLAVEKFTGEQVAIKYLPRGSNLQGAERELLNLRACAINPHIIKFKEAFLTDSYLAVVTEYADLGDLADHVERRRRKGTSPGRGLTVEESRLIFQQLMLALEFCHAKGIANRDLKMENLLLSSSTDTPLRQSPSVKLCDFGFSKDEKANSMCKTACGTPEYVAPEVLLYNAYNGKGADIWSAGVMLYCMLTGAYPFQDPEDSKLPPSEQLQVMFPRIVSARFPQPSWLGEDCLSLLRGMMEADPSKRLTVDGVLSHPWFLHGLPEGVLETNRNLLSVSDLLMASFCTQTEEAIRAICKRALRRGNRASNRPRQSRRPVQHCSASSVVAPPKPSAPEPSALKPHARSKQAAETQAALRAGNAAVAAPPLPPLQNGQAR